MQIHSVRDALRWVILWQMKNDTNSLIQNYINGNLTDAKEQARGVNHMSIRLAFQGYGFGVLTSCCIADYLKGLRSDDGRDGSFQAACDAEHSEHSFDMPFSILSAR
jgi:hypothetical protein